MEESAKLLRIALLSLIGLLGFSPQFLIILAWGLASISGLPWIWWLYFVIDLLFPQIQSANGHGRIT